MRRVNHSYGNSSCELDRLADGRRAGPAPACAEGFVRLLEWVKYGAGIAGGRPR